MPKRASTCLRCWKSAVSTGPLVWPCWGPWSPWCAPVEAEWYQPQEQQALARISERDPDDWPALACALTLDCPVWTEDADFFGTGVATWTTSRVKLYLAPVAPIDPDAS